MDLDAIIARLEGTDGVFGVNGGDAVCKEAAALLRLQASIIASRDEHRLTLNSYQAMNLREALRAVTRGSSALRALHTGDWCAEIQQMLEQKKIDRDPNRTWQRMCLDAEHRTTPPKNDDTYVCPFCDCVSNARSPRCCDKAAAMRPSEYHVMVAAMVSAGISKRADAVAKPKDGATVVEGPLIGMDVILADRDEWKRRALAAEGREASSCHPSSGGSARAEVHSVVVTGNEPHGGVTVVIDRGDVAHDRYVCVEIPRSLLGGLVSALVKVALDPPSKEEIAVSKELGDGG